MTSRVMKIDNALDFSLGSRKIKIDLHTCIRFTMLFYQRLKKKCWKVGCNYALIYEKLGDPFIRGVPFFAAHPQYIMSNEYPPPLGGIVIKNWIIVNHIWDYCM